MVKRIGSNRNGYERGLVTEERITEACENVYTTRFALGCFADDCEYDAIDYSVVRSKKHRELAKKAATDMSSVLKDTRQFYSPCGEWYLFLTSDIASQWYCLRQFMGE